MRIKKINIQILIEGKPDKLPYPSNAPIPRVGEYIVNPDNTGYMLIVDDVTYAYNQLIGREMLISIYTITY